MMKFLILLASCTWVIIGLSSRMAKGHWSPWALYVFIAGLICVIVIKLADCYTNDQKGGG